MASTFSSRLRFELQGNGENSNTWGTKANGVFQRIEESVAGMATVNTTGGTYALTTANGTTDEARNAILKFTGTLASNSTITVPSVSKRYLVWNATSGSFTLTVKTAGGSGVVVPQGKTVEVFCDGTDVKDSVTALNAVEVEDEDLVLVDPADRTKKVKFDAGAVTTGTTRTLASPDASGTIATEEFVIAMSVALG